jgi:hypothetical protein
MMPRLQVLRLPQSRSGGCHHHYRQRTRWNIRDSDATLILTWGPATGGTLLTLNVCKRMGRPGLVVDLRDEAALPEMVQVARAWLNAELVGKVLNVAGPRASHAPEIPDRAKAFLREVLAIPSSP